MNDQVPVWERRDGRTSLVYQGYTLAYYQLIEGGVEVTTRAYSQGPVRTRRVATEEGARRYADAWMVKWGDHAIAEVRSKVHFAEVQRLPSDGLDSLGRPYPKIEVKPRRPRRSRR